MTIKLPDISGYQAGISLSGMLAVIVKATEGTTYTNPDYVRVAKDATSRGIPWAAYHFLHHGNTAAQAQHYSAVAGNTPCMLDVETAGDGTMATVQDALSFASNLRSLGGRVRLVYLPHWYWQAIGSPDLRPLAQAGMALVSSNYTTYSDTGPGWAAYGGVTPTVWQYTDAASVNHFTVDMNAFKGSQDDFRALLSGGTSMTDSQNITDLHDRSNWEVTPATELTATTAGHPLPGSMIDRLNAFVQDPKAFLADVFPAQTVNVDASAVVSALVADPTFIAAIGAAVADNLAARLQS